MSRPAPRHIERVVQNASSSSQTVSGAFNGSLFLDPMLGSNLTFFIEKEVQEKDSLTDIIQKCGGNVSAGYSGVTYILVDPHTEAGQNLFRQYASKKGKIILDSRWIHECVRKNELLSYQYNWAGCKVTGKEPVHPRAGQGSGNVSSNQTQIVRPQLRTVPQPELYSQRQPQPSQHIHPQGHHLSQTHHIIHPQPQPQQQSQQQHNRAQMQASHSQHPQQQHQLSLSHPSQVQVHQQQSHQPPSHSTTYPNQQIQQSQTHMLSPASTLTTSFTHYPVYNSQSQQPTQQHGQRPSMPPPAVTSTHTWQQTPTPITPNQHSTHLQILAQRPQDAYGREDQQWNSNNTTFSQLAPSTNGSLMPSINHTHHTSYYDQRYRNDQSGWPETQDYYEQPQPTYTHTYQTTTDSQYVPIAEPTTLEQASTIAPAPVPQPVSAPVPPTTVVSPNSTPTITAEHDVVTSPVPQRQTSLPAEEQRGRKRVRAPPQATPSASNLVLNKGSAMARSPTPPNRVIKSTYGGNLFTADDVTYLQKYIEYCQDQGLPLSLREICERIAVKAPHHTFYSWRRYCNKHQIRLRGYIMKRDESRSPSPSQDADRNSTYKDDTEYYSPVPLVGEGPYTVQEAKRMYQNQGTRNRSPTPPRALFRSTTGKGVAFTPDDIAFLCKFMAHRQLLGRFEMVSFWKDVAARAPHHSRASWMKYYRRHKHELNRNDGDEPLPAPPAKKMRYGRRDDVLLATYFANKPEGTSDKIFQAFAKLHPHHPWKGWQEHHRIHKTKIDHLIEQIKNGIPLDAGDENDDE